MKVRRYAGPTGPSDGTFWMIQWPLIRILKDTTRNECLEINLSLKDLEDIHAVVRQRLQEVAMAKLDLLEKEQPCGEEG